MLYFDVMTVIFVFAVMKAIVASAVYTCKSLPFNKSCWFLFFFILKDHQDSASYPQRMDQTEKISH